jgi:hypothetical protein
VLNAPPPHPPNPGRLRRSRPAAAPAARARWRAAPRTSRRWRRASSSATRVRGSARRGAGGGGRFLGGGALRGSPGSRLFALPPLPPSANPSASPPTPPPPPTHTPRPPPPGAHPLCRVLLLPHPRHQGDDALRRVVLRQPPGHGHGAQRQHAEAVPRCAATRGAGGLWGKLRWAALWLAPGLEEALPLLSHPPTPTPSPSTPPTPPPPPNPHPLTLHPHNPSPTPQPPPPHPPPSTPPPPPNPHPLTPHPPPSPTPHPSRSIPPGSPYLSKIESIASSAVRAADKVKASLIVVYTHTGEGIGWGGAQEQRGRLLPRGGADRRARSRARGAAPPRRRCAACATPFRPRCTPHPPTPGRTAQLVAKYRPPMPILTLVVPRLVSDTLHWRLEGRCAPPASRAAAPTFVLRLHPSGCRRPRAPVRLTETRAPAAAPLHPAPGTTRASAY